MMCETQKDQTPFDKDGHDLLICMKSPIAIGNNFKLQLLLGLEGLSDAYRHKCQLHLGQTQLSSCTTKYIYAYAYACFGSRYRWGKESAAGTS